jgi:gas vesicle protein
MANNENQQVDNSENNINTKDFLIGALIGGVVGAAAALFLTPKSGKDIRHDISHQAQSLKDLTGQFREAAVSKGTELAEVAKERTATLGQTVSKQSNELITKVKGLKPIASENTEEEISAASENSSDIQRKLEETKKAFDETELQLNK